MDQRPGQPDTFDEQASGPIATGDDMPAATTRGVWVVFWALLAVAAGLPHLVDSLKFVVGGCVGLLAWLFMFAAVGWCGAARGSWWFTVGATVAIHVTMYFGDVVHVSIVRAFPRPRLLPSAQDLPIYAVVFVLSASIATSSHFSCWRIRSDRRAQLVGAHRCGTCGYDLTGNISGRCPECGTSLPASAPTPPADRQT